MAEMTIALRIDPDTGKKNIIVTLHSDEDALPQEHEQMHRSLVNKLIEGGLLKEGEEGNLVVERLDKEKPPEVTPGQEEPQKQAQGQGR